MKYQTWIERGRGEDGQAIVELAVVFVLLSTLVFGGIEFGRALNSWAIVTQASREGARSAAALCSGDPGCSAVVQTSIENALVGLNVAAARWNMDPAPYVAGSPLLVHVEYDVVPLTPLIAALVPGGQFTVVGETTMRLE